MHLIWKSKEVKGGGRLFIGTRKATGGEQGTQGEPWICKAREGGGRPFLTMVLVFTQTDTCQKAERLTNVRGRDDWPCGGGVRHINHSNHSSAHSGLPALGSRAGFPFPALLDKAGLCFTCWVKGGWNVIWKSRWDSGAAQVGYRGRLGPLRRGEGLAGQGEGRYLKLWNYLGVLRIKRI